MPKLAASEISKLLRYEPETGRLFWRYRPQGPARWNTRYAGKEAFTATSNGYRIGRIYDRAYKAHQVIWAIMTGAWPEHEIDHEDGDPGNNRWGNLKDKTHCHNMRNMKAHKDGSSGVKGVSWHARNKNWRVRIGGRHVGSFGTLAEAKAARLSAAQNQEGYLA